MYIWPSGYVCIVCIFGIVDIVGVVCILGIAGVVWIVWIVGVTGIIGSGGTVGLEGIVGILGIVGIKSVSESRWHSWCRRCIGHSLEDDHWLPLVYIGTFSNHSLVEFPSGFPSLFNICHHSSTFEANLYLIIGNTEFIAELDPLQN